MRVLLCTLIHAPPPPPMCSPHLPPPFLGSAPAPSDQPLLSHVAFACVLLPPPTPTPPSDLGSLIPHRAPQLQASLVPTCRLTYPVCVCSLSSWTPRSTIEASHRVILTQRTWFSTREASGLGMAYPATTFNNHSARQVTKLPFSSCRCRRSSLTSIFSSIQHALGNDVMFLN